MFFKIFINLYYLIYIICCFDIHVHYKIIILSLLLGIYIWSLSLAQNSKNPWNFLSDKSSWQTPFNHTWVYVIEEIVRASLVAQLVKNPPSNAGDMVLMSGLGRSPGEGNGNPLQYSCLGNPMDRGTMGSKRVRQDWVCAYEHTHTHTHTHLRMGAGCQGNQPCDERIGSFSPTPLTSKDEVTRGCIDHQWLMTIISMEWNLYKKKKSGQDSGNCQVGEYVEIGREC